MKKLFLYSLALSALAFSCDDDTPDPVPTAYGDLVWENTLTLQGQEISLNSNENIPASRFFISRIDVYRQR